MLTAVHAIQGILHLSLLLLVLNPRVLLIFVLVQMELDQTKVKYTFMLGKKGIESGNLECCLQDSTKTKCTEYVKCGQIQSDRINSMYFPNITYTRIVYHRRDSIATRKRSKCQYQ